MFAKSKRSPAALAAAFLAFTLCAAAALSGHTLATPGRDFEIVGRETLGLVVAVEPDDGRLFNISNMYPGDRAETRVTVRNQGNDPFSLSVAARMDDNDGGDRILYEALELTVRNNEEVVRGALSSLEDGLQLGRIPPGGQRVLYLALGLPAEAGNELQGRRLSLKWTFAATWPDPGTGPGPGPGPEPDPGSGPGPDPGPPPEADAGPAPAPVLPPESLELDPEKVPTAPAAPDPDTPAAPALPRTGEMPPLVFYAVGLLLAAAGMMLGWKQRQSKR